MTRLTVHILLFVFAAILNAAAFGASGTFKLTPHKGGKHYTACLMRYSNEGLTLYALVATPKDKPANARLPVIIANHGFHPNPPKYGITRDGTQWRPGDYYRDIPDAYTAKGFLVVMPDYRGHNASEGYTFTQSEAAPQHYASDVRALVPLISKLRQADTNNMFMWGHSMGGLVTLHSLFEEHSVRAASIRAASIWSTMSFSPLEELRSFPTPLVVHHALEDKTTSYQGSQNIVMALQQHNAPVKAFTYPGPDHLFRNAAFTTAVERDAQFFNDHLEAGNASAQIHPPPAAATSEGCR